MIKNTIITAEFFAALGLAGVKARLVSRAAISFMLRAGWLIVLTALASCERRQENTPGVSAENPVVRNETRKLNDIRLIGSHNSYKMALPPALLSYLENVAPESARKINYSHNPLSAQLDAGLRKLEIDVLADPKGGRYLTPFALKMLAEQGDTIDLNEGFDRQALSQPGLKVLHVPDIDIFSHCARFIDCLMQMKDWSDRHPEHLPIFVLINVKEKAALGIPDAVQPLQFGPEEYADIDTEIRSVLPANKLILPDDIRREHATLRQAVINDAWPSLADTRGKFVFIFDGNAQQDSVYLQGHPSLQGRVMFAATDPENDAAAILVINNPIEQQAEIQAWVSQGFIVRTRSDANFGETVEQMQRRYQAALDSGAQIISTDFYSGAPNDKDGYFVPLPEKPDQ